MSSNSYFKIALLRCDSYTLKFTLLKYTDQWFLVYSEISEITTMLNQIEMVKLKKSLMAAVGVNFRIFSSKGNRVSFSYHSAPPISLAQRTANLLSVLIDWTLWNLTDFCAWLLSLSIMISRFIQIVACIHISFLWPNNIALCGYTTLKKIKCLQFQTSK